jgi:hypothetical protein
MPPDAEEGEHEQWIAMITIQAPAANFVQITTRVTTNVARGPDTVDQRPPTPARISSPEPVAHHPGLGEREGGEHTDHVEMDESLHVGVVDPDQGGRDCGQDDDAVGEDEPVAEVGELPREEPVAGEQRGEPREALVRGVRRQDQDGHSRGLGPRST